jgi:ketopantoate reductase
MNALHVAIVGAGSLGSVYGVRLARHGAAVTFVVRPASAADTRPLCIQRVGSPDHLELASPKRSAVIPSDADVVVLAVRAESVDQRLEGSLLAVPEAPVLTLTPFMPSTLERMRALLGARVVVAMPGVVAYAADGGVVRYWLFRSAPTRIDDRGAAVPAVRTLRERLVEAGVPARFEPHVDTTNPATTMTFLPLVLALDAAGGTAAAAAADGALLALALDAVSECREVASAVGRVPAWVGVLAHWAGPRSIRLGIGLGRRTFPESVRFVEQHFGSKTHRQNVLLGRDVVALGRKRGLSMSALSRLADRCAARGAPLPPTSDSSSRRGDGT